MGELDPIYRNRPTPAAADLFGDLLEVDATSATKRARPQLLTYLPGLGITGIAALAAAWLGDHYHAPLMLMGLLIGLAFNFLNADARLHAGLGFASKTLLRWGIVLVGLQVTIWEIAALGWPSFVAIAVMIVAVMTVGTLVSRALGLGAAFGTLAGGSVAICGASAALALSSVLGEKRVNQAQLTLVLVAVSAASALAMSTYPILSNLLGLSPHAAGFLLGASIHDVAQALGAGYSLGEVQGQTAAIVKLTRVALLAPTLLLVTLTLPKDGHAKTGAPPVPWFIVAFLALTAFNSVVTLPPQVAAAAKIGTSALLLLAVVATGIRSPMHLLLQQGWRASMPVVAATVTSFLLALAAAELLF
ncbi:YeiH family protein [Sphingomonas tabacisoli]|uniref:YeiH family protein n=1 Tax=Sphingomonas tabacisoli TaxID=2249466 RepID=A0ABW4I3N8_9SPHN